MADDTNAPSMSAPPTVALLAAMTSEMTPLARALGLRRTSIGGLAVRTGTVGPNRIVASVVGIGPAMATKGTERMLDAVTPDRVVLAGVSGAIAAGLRIGTVLAPALVVDQASGDRFTPRHSPGTSPEGTLLTCTTLQVGDDVLSALRTDGVMAVDMETAAVGAVCDRRGVPWTVFRVISDRLEDDLVDESILALTRPDGSTNIGAVLRLLVRRPADVKRLAAIGRDTKVALRALAATTAAELAVAPASS